MRRDATFVVIAYDVADDRRRVRVFKALKDYGQHVQFSVFECDLRRRDVRRLQARLLRLIDPAVDNIRFYYLDRAAVAEIESVGRERALSPDRSRTFWIV